ncbi:MAG: ABC transporter permease [Flavobacteriales bacterium]
MGPLPRGGHARRVRRGHGRAGRWPRRCLPPHPRRFRDRPAPQGARVADAGPERRGRPVRQPCAGVRAHHPRRRTGTRGAAHARLGQAARTAGGRDPRFWYNLRMSYRSLMVPGLLVVLVTLAGMFLSSMNIAREKEVGTIEQINVTPIRKWQFILGKLLPFWFISLFLLAFGLAVGRLVFHIPMEGSVFLLFAFAAVYLWVMLGLGLLISTVSDTQQQSMFLSWFFLVIFVLLSGLFTPIDNMPHWAQRITWLNPVSYFVEVVRMVLLKGSGFMDIARHFAVIGAFAVGINALAVVNYRKRA